MGLLQNGTVKQTCPSSSPSAAHKMGRWPSSSPGKGVSGCTVGSFVFQAGPNQWLSPNWNSLSLLLCGQAPMTSIRKGVLPFSGWPRRFAASSLLCRQGQGQGRGRELEQGPVAHNSLIGHQRVWSGQELTVRDQGTAEALVVSDKGQEIKSLILECSLPG